MFTWLRRLWAAFTGVFIERADQLNTNTNVVRSTFDAAQKQSKNRINEVRNAVSKIMAIKSGKVQEIKDLSEQVKEYQQIKDGAKGMALARKALLEKQGKSREEIEKDPEYIECSTGFRDASSTLAEKEARIEGLEKDIEQQESQIEQFKIQLRSMQSELEKLHSEEQEHIADLETSKAIEETNSILAGLSEDTTSNDLAEIRKARTAAKSKAEITQELAGNEVKQINDKFREFAGSNKANSEFDALMGWDEETSETEKESSKLPE